MADDLHLDKVVKGYLVLANELLTNWTPFLNSVSSKVAGGNYQPTDAQADFSSGAKLVVESMALIGSEAFDAVATMTSDYNEQKKVSGYNTDPAYAATVRTLAVKADLVSVTGKQLPKERVTPNPSTLAVGVTAFDLDVNGDGMKARTYDGVIVATDANGVAQEVKVSVTIG